LPPKQASRAIIISAGVGVLVLLIDLYGPEGRPTVVRPIFTVGLIVGIMVIYAIFVARQFKNYSLRTKLIATLLVVSVLSVGMVAFFANRTITKTLTEDTGANLNNLANVQALAVGNLLARQVEALRSLSLSRNLKDDLFLSNTKYGTDPAEIQAKLAELEQRWVVVSDETNFLVEFHLRNTSAQELQEFRDAFPDHVEVYVTDKYGGILGATDRTSAYYQADEAWWQAAYNNGQGDIFIGLPEFDERSAALGLSIALPIYDKDRTVIGILYSTYRLATLQELMASVELGQTGQAEIYLPGGLKLTLDKNELEPGEFDLNLLTPSQTAGGGYVEALYGGVPRLVSQAPVVAITGEPVIADLGWAVVAHQNKEEALAPVEAQTQTSLLLALAIVSLAAAVAVAMAQLLAGPITRLTAVAGQVAGGELTVQAEIESKDEIGQLATTFNMMTGQLRETIDTLEQRVADRTQRLEIVANLGERLSAILDVEQLLLEIVNQVKESFDYYHAHVYILDEEKRDLVMTAGAGEPGRQMKAKGHHISLDAPTSLVARAARTGQIVWVDNVREAEDWLPNPLLPDTFSEMAIPIVLEEKVVGVLDVQEDEIASLDEGDANLLRSLANQVAVAMRNARLFEEVQSALAEAHAVQERYFGQAWDKAKVSKEIRQYLYVQPGAVPLDETKEQVLTEARQQALAQEGLTVLALDDNGSKAKTLVTPITLRDQPIGALQLYTSGEGEQWTGDDLAAIETILNQFTQTAENLRLFDEARGRASFERKVSEIAKKLQQAPNLEALTKIAGEELGKALGVSHGVVRLGITPLVKDTRTGNQSLIGEEDHNSI
jgi:GAF domain-containing protein/HAMP domain-containing protein